MTAPPELTPLDVKAMRDLEIRLAKLRGVKLPEPPTLTAKDKQNPYLELWLQERSRSALLQEQNEELLKINEGMVEQTKTQEVHNQDLRTRIRDALQHVDDCVECGIDNLPAVNQAVNFIIFDRQV